MTTPDKLAQMQRAARRLAQRYLAGDAEAKTSVWRVLKLAASPSVGPQENPQRARAILAAKLLHRALEDVKAGNVEPEQAEEQASQSAGPVAVVPGLSFDPQGNVVAGAGQPIQAVAFPTAAAKGAPREDGPVVAVAPTKLAREEARCE